MYTSKYTVHIIIIYVLRNIDFQNECNRYTVGSPGGRTIDRQVYTDLQPPI